MAYKTLPPPGFHPGPLPVFYNVNNAVGPTGKPNIDDDVRLVQLCLQQIFLKPDVMRAPPNGLKIVADGKCGPITQNAIWWFQSESKRRGINIYPDGVVDKASDYKAATSAMHVIYSMLWLNLALMRAIGEARFINLENESICPYPLKVRLALSDI